MARRRASCTKLKRHFRIVYGVRPSDPFRGTLGLPVTLPDPPTAWATPYAAMARADALPWPDLAAVTEAARRFLEPVLREAIDAIWEPAEAVWKPW